MNDTNGVPAQARPAELVRLATARWGRREFVRRCVCLLRTMSWNDAPELLSYLGGAADPAAQLAEDPVARVRTAAARVLAETGEGEHAEALRRMIDDADPMVGQRAESALERMAERLDRTL